jgi:hypothetical protein
MTWLSLCGRLLLVLSGARQRRLQPFAGALNRLGHEHSPPGFKEVDQAQSTPMALPCVRSV